MMAKDNLSGDDGFPSAKGGRAALAAIAHHSTVPCLSVVTPYSSYKALNYTTEGVEAAAMINGFDHWIIQKKMLPCWLLLKNG